MNYQGHIENGAVVTDQPLPLPNGTLVSVEPVRLHRDFWRPATLDELASEQGVVPPKSVDDLIGGWPADELDDEFEEALRSWRARELES